MITYCNLHNPILDLYKFYHSTMELKDHLQLERIKTPAQSGLIHALYQLDALPFLLALEKAPREHGRRTFCGACYYLGYYKKDCPFYWCPHYLLTWPHHDKDQCLDNPKYSGPTIIKQESPSPPPLRVPLPKTIKKHHYSPTHQNSNFSSSSNRVKKRGHKGMEKVSRECQSKSGQRIWRNGSKIWTRT